MAPEKRAPYPMRMLHTIRTGPAAAATNEPIELLLACHVRLRHFSQLSLALATRAPLPREDAVDASSRLLRYFRIALPLHEADEEQTVAPALLETPARALVQDAIGTMTAQHRELHAILDTLMPAWDRTATEPGGVPPELGAARGLASLLDAHLALEEQTIFPSLSEVGAARRVELLGEMRARRTPEIMATMQEVVGR